MPILLLKDIFNILTSSPEDLKFIKKKGYNLDNPINEPHSETGSLLIHKAAHHDKEKIVATLVKEGGVDVNLPASPSSKEFHGQTSLCIAASNRSRRTVSFLIHQKADLEKCDAWGEFPLAKAARTDDTDCLKLLLDAGANINQENLSSVFINPQNLPHKHMTALMYALENCMSDAAKLLLDYGAEVVNSQGRNALLYCSYEDVREKMKIKIEKRHTNAQRQYRVLNDFSFSDSIVKLIFGYTHGYNYNHGFFSASQKQVKSSSQSTSKPVLLREDHSSKRRRVR